MTQPFEGAVKITDILTGLVIIKTRSHYDRSKNPVVNTYQQLTLEEAKKLPQYGHVLFITRFGTAMNAKITSVKTWKRHPENCDVNLKIGMYEYGTATYRDGQPVNEQLVKILEDTTGL